MRGFALVTAKNVGRPATDNLSLNGTTPGGKPLIYLPSHIASGVQTVLGDHSRKPVSWTFG